MKGLLADVNDVKQVRLLLMLMQEETRAELVADRLLEYLFDMDNLRGSGRLYLP